MLETDSIYLGGAADQPQRLQLRYANRHGLITGATGTGKTVSLQIMAEGFSRAGVPVFCADIKGDLSGIAIPGTPGEPLLERAKQLGLNDYAPETFPTIFWDLFGRQGHPVRATISEMGPLLLARVLDLNDVQEGVLNVAFQLADDEGLLLLDLEDLRALLIEVEKRRQELSASYGNVASPSIGAIQRALLVLEQQGGGHFFGERALSLADIMRTDTSGRGVISVLAASELMSSPRLYATFLLWLLSELFEDLPEVGDPDKPRLVFFFDEAHLLFEDASSVLVDKIEQLVKLIRSKGVGVYFVTQNPLDVPDPVLAQLSNRVQHALRAYTPREQKAVRTAAETFRPNPAFSTEEAITQLNVGEALVSVLEAKGAPSMVQRTLIRPPSSRLGPITPEERRQVMTRSPVAGLYDAVEDRESAAEELARRAQQRARSEQSEETAPGRTQAPGSSRQSYAEAIGKSLARSVASSLGRALVRGMLGGLRRL